MRLLRIPMLASLAVVCAGQGNPPAAVPPVPVQPRPRYARRAPSAQEGDRAFPVVPAGGAEADSGREFGSAMHSLLCRLEWLDTEPLDAVLARWRQAAGWPEDLAARVEAEFRRCLEAPAIRGVFTRPQGRWPELWRERAFDLIAGDVWVSGVFDRVVIERDAAGTCRRATLYDFKTDRVGPRPSDLKAAVRRYRDQIAGYRAALEKLCALGPSDVAARLVFLVPGRVEEA